MAIPPIPDADPDPTTQMAWPSGRFRRITVDEQEAPPLHDDSAESSSSRGAEENVKVSLQVSSRDEPSRARLTTWNLITLSIAMGGSQVAWTVELG
jgi:solute carrier family 45, member 1/2/4